MSLITMSKIISEQEFSSALTCQLEGLHIFRSVSGPGRSGVIAAVYASYILGIPFLPQGAPIPDNMRPHLVIDTAQQTGRTLRKAAKKACTPFYFAVYSEPPRLHFFYER